MVSNHRFYLMSTQELTDILHTFGVHDIHVGIICLKTVNVFSSVILVCNSRDDINWRTFGGVLRLGLLRYTSTYISFTHF